MRGAAGRNQFRPGPAHMCAGLNNWKGYRPGGPPSDAIKAEKSLPAGVG